MEKLDFQILVLKVFSMSHNYNKNLKVLLLKINDGIFFCK